MSAAGGVLSSDAGRKAAAGSPRGANVRHGLLSLLVVAVAPATLMIVALFMIETERAQRRESARLEFAQHAETVAATQDRVLRGSRNALIGLAGHPSIGPRPAADCGDVLRQFMRQAAGYEGLLVVAPDGGLLCSSAVTRGPISYADRPYFREAMATKSFTVGRYAMGRSTGQPLLPVAYPVMGAEDEVAYVLVAGHTLGWLDGLLADLRLPAEATVFVVDPVGGLVSRRSGRRADPGSALDDPTLAELLRDGATGAFEGERELFGIAALSLLIPGIHAVVQIDKDVVFGPIDAFHNRSVAVVGGLTLASVMALWLLSEMLIRRPMRRLLSTIGRMEHGDLDARVGMAARVGEMAQLGQAFDGMAERLQQRERQLRQAQKMEAIGNLTGGLAHDFNNLLTILTGNLTLLMEGRKADDPDAGLLEDALEAAWRGADLTRQLLAFARRQPLEARRVDVNDHLRKLIRLMQRTLGDDIRIDTGLASDIWPVAVDPTQLETAVLNLATNARDAMPGGGRLAIETSNVSVSPDYAEMNPGIEPGEYVVIAVTDTGTGIDSADLERIFEPFFTTKEVGAGTGLGLAMVFGFARQTGGQVKAYSELGRGTTMRLYLPRDVGGSEAATVDAADAAAAGQGEAVLVVDDNEHVRRVVVRQLAELGYRPVDARGAVDALEQIECRPEIAAMVTDVLMPDVDGVTLARMALSKRPDLAVVYVSGFPGLSFSGDRSLPEGAVLISKPFRKQDLGARLRQAIAGGREPDVA